MGLNVKDFLKERFEPRKKEMLVPQLKDWFPEGEKPIWTVQSITAADMVRADEAAGNERFTGKILEALTSLNSPDVVEQVKELVGKSDDKPRSIAKRIYHLIYGSADPVCTLELSVKLCDSFPVIFLELTNEILSLSGQGFEPGKLKPFWQDPEIKVALSLCYARG